MSTVTVVTLHSLERATQERSLPEGMASQDVLGWDQAESRWVVASSFGGVPFGLTICCNAYDKGAEDGIVCRRCYGTADTGRYYFGWSETAYPEVWRKL